VSDARRFFDAIAPRYDREYALSGHTSRRRMERVDAALRAVGPAPLDVLCLGLGTGRELPSLFDAGHVPVGVEVSPEMIALCKKRRRVPHIVEADFYAPLPFANAGFDAVLALHGALAHPPDVDAYGAVARELARVLRPGGVLLAEVPDGARLSSLAGEAGDVKVAGRGEITRFEHVDPRGPRLAGVALTAAEWARRLAPHLLVHADSLEPEELWLVATRA
jgi:SAM-dependent methyltransferase